jgi:predicted nucleic acid-binding protein
MKTKVYLDTSVISALFDERTPERMAMTKAAWDRFNDYEVYLSNVVIEELSSASQPLRNKMLEMVSRFGILPASDMASSLAGIYVNQGIFPAKYFDDALHVAIASTNQIGILLSWNFTHLVKIKTRRMVALVNTAENYIPVEIIAPPEL